MDECNVIMVHMEAYKIAQASKCILVKLFNSVITHFQNLDVEKVENLVENLVEPIKWKT